MKASSKGLVIVIVIGAFVALFPVIAGVIDNMMYESSQASVITTTSLPAGVKILVPQLVSQQGADRLVVEPGKAIVPAGETIDVKIYVYFKHTQPCPYSDWHVEYSVSGGIEVVSDDGGKLVDPKTYERTLVIKVNSPGTLTVTYYYGSGCPEGTMERVVAEFYTSEEQAGNSTLTSTTTPTQTTSEEETYTNITGKVVSINTEARYIVVGNKSVYVRGTWLDITSNKTLTDSEVVNLIKPGDTVVVVCKVTGSGRLMAEKIIVNGTLVLERTE
ncbi:MAG: hypothetical protein GXO43_05675 [Crenarchaeota archaeon]|nr:hypothetical protein [Thermoproteota archaeon]